MALVEVEDLNERDGELDLDRVRRVEDRTCEVARPFVASYEEVGKVTLARQLKIVGPAMNTSVALAVTRRYLQTDAI